MAETYQERVSAEQVKFMYEELNRLKIPQFQAANEIERQKMAQQAAQHAAELQFRQRQQQETERAGREGESINRGSLALQGAQQAGQEAIQRQNAALQAFQQADQSQIAREGLGLQGLQSAENISLANRQLALQGAGQQSAEALDALKLAASLQGPSNAFVQQAVMHGLNNQGLSRAVDAIAGQYDLPSFQAPQADPEAMSLSTLARDIQQAGGVRSGSTGGSLAMRIANDAAADSYRAGGGRALAYGQDTLDDPSTRGADAAMMLGVNNAANPYGSPSQSIALGIAGTNAPEANPYSMSEMTKGTAQQLVDIYNEWIDNHVKAGGNNYLEYNDPQLVAMIKQATGLDDGQALQLAKQNADYYNATRQVIPTDRMENLIGQHKQNAALASVQAPIGQAQATTNAYNSVLARDNVPYLSYNDPRMVDIYRNAGGLSQGQAMAAAQRASDYYKATGTAMTGDRLGANIADARGTGQYQPFNPAGTGEALRQGYDQLVARDNTGYLSYNDPRLVQLYQQVGGLTREQALQATQRASDYYRDTGGTPMNDYMNTQNVRDVRVNADAGRRQAGADGGRVQSSVMPGADGMAQDDFSPESGQLVRRGPLAGADPGMGSFATLGGADAMRGGPDAAGRQPLQTQAFGAKVAGDPMKEMYRRIQAKRVSAPMA